MKLAALILIHRYPEQAITLISTLLSHPQVQVIVHVDAKAQACFEMLKKEFKANERVEFVQPRYRVFWGSYQQIQASYALLQAAEKSKCDYAVLLSGQDFPIKPISEIVSFFEVNQNKNFVVNFPLPNPQWAEGGLQRLWNYHFNSEKFPFLLRKVNALLYHFQKLFGIKRPLQKQYYGGSNWFNLNAATIKAVCKYIETHPRYLKQFKYTRCADEIFLQTVLALLTDNTELVNTDLRFVDRSTAPEYPRTWRSVDNERMLSTEQKLFARKFDSTVDSEILSKLQAHVTR